MEESEDKRGFKVQDRRRFSAEGETKEGAEDRPEEPPKKPEPASASKHESVGATAGAQSRPSRAASEPQPELTFAAFVWSLSEQALAALGEIADPSTGKPMHDLILAQQMIDIIIMLREKTRGNLDPAENSLLESALYDLRMRYVDRARAR